MKQIKIPINIFRHGIKIIFGSIEELRKTIKKDNLDEREIDEDAINNSLMITLCFPSGDALIYGKEFINSVEGRSILTHEIFHAVSYILRNIGIEHTPDTEEVYAYVIEYVEENALIWLSSELRE